VTLLTTSTPARPVSHVRRRALTTAVAVLGLGILLGVLWWVAAPMARADVAAGQAYLSGHQELQVAQDGWFAVVTGLAGVLAATLLALRLGRVAGSAGPAAASAARSAALSAAKVPVLGVVVALVAWRTGVLLGPPSLADQVAAGTTNPLTPLQLHAYGVLLVGPFLYTVTRFLAALFTAEPVAAG